MKFFAAACLGVLLSFTVLTGQSIEEQVNNDVWYPFVDAYNSLDVEAFMSVHAHDVVRVNRDSKSIREGSDYASGMANYFAGDKERGFRNEISLSFLERIYGDSSGFEVGIYRVRRTTGGQQQLYYGKFHVLLRKIDGKWKIAMDSDYSGDGMVTEEAFLTATPLPQKN